MVIRVSVMARSYAVYCIQICGFEWPVFVQKKLGVQGYGSCGQYG